MNYLSNTNYYYDDGQLHITRLISPASLQNPLMPRSDSLSHFLSQLRRCRKSQVLKVLNSLLISHGLINRHSAVEHFVHHCCHLGFPDLALPAFRTIEHPNLRLQNLILRSLSDNGSFRDVLLVYKRCRLSRVSSDNYTYPFVLKACAALSDVRFGNMVHGVVSKTGFCHNLVVQTTLLDFYSKTGEVGNARKVTDEMSHPDLVARNALISGYSVNGLDYEALESFQDMVSVGVNPNASTFASVFPVCSRVEVDGLCVFSLHGLAYKLGYDRDDSLVPALISVYANLGDLKSAGAIFDTSTRKNVVIWNALISAYTRNQEPKNAFAVFKTMLLDETKANMVTFVSLIPSSENLGSILHVESLHTIVVKYGFEKEVSVVTALLSVYSKLGNMNSAEFLFNNVRVRNILLWNSMVSAYAGHGLWKESLDAFRLMQMEGGFIPDAVSIVSLLSSCSELKAKLLGKSAHAFSIKRDIDLNLNLLNALLAFYCECRELVYSFRIFDKVSFKNNISWNTMISGCSDNGELEEAVILFHEMRRRGVNFDSVTLISILPICHDCENLILGSAIQCYAIKTSLLTDIHLANALVSMYVNCGELEAARLLFDGIPDRSVVSWNAILTGYRHCHSHDETIELFKEMIKEDIKPNYVTLLNVLPACNIIFQGKSLHAYIVRNMIRFETPLLTSLMIMYARYGFLESCMILFRAGDKKSISLWNTIISAHLFSKRSTMAFSFFCEMLRNKVEPDFITVLNLISACVQIQNLHISNSVLAYLVRTGFEKDVAISNALIDSYAKCGKISTARTLFDVSTQKDTISWSVMINGYGLHGDGVGALSLYSQMRVLGLKPDRVTYMSILSACSHAGFVEQGIMVFDSMLRDDIVPGMEHYACMIDLFGRTGHLNEAYEMFKNLPNKRSANLLGSLLGACLSHGNHRLGEEIGKFVMDKNPGDSTPYVVLHNIYALGGKWVDANNVRVVMEQNEVIKDPGISLLDRNASIHLE